MSKIHSKIKIPVALASKGGVLEAFVWDNWIRGHKPTFNNDVVTLNGLNPKEQPTFTELTAIVLNGGSFEGITLGLQFTALAAGRDVPAGVPGSTITPEGEATRQKTWLEWIQGNSQTVYQRVSGTPVYYVIKGALGGDILTSEELDAARTTSGVNVIEFSDFKARIQSDNYEKYEII